MLKSKNIILKNHFVFLICVVAQKGPHSGLKFDKQCNPEMSHFLPQKLKSTTFDNFSYEVAAKEPALILAFEVEVIVQPFIQILFIALFFHFYLIVGHLGTYYVV